MRYTLTKRAHKQLEQITYYIALDKPQAAQRVFERVLETCQIVADMPGIGRNPTYISNQEVLCVNVKQYTNYLIYYRKRQKEVIILHIIDGRRNLPDLFDDK